MSDNGVAKSRERRWCLNFISECDERDMGYRIE